LLARARRAVLAGDEATLDALEREGRVASLPSLG